MADYDQMVKDSKDAVGYEGFVDRLKAYLHDPNLGLYGCAVFNAAIAGFGAGAGSSLNGLEGLAVLPAIGSVCALLTAHFLGPEEHPELKGLEATVHTE